MTDEKRGRKATGRRKINFYITEDEEKYLRAEIKRMRTQETLQQSQPIIKMTCCHHMQALSGINELPEVGQETWCIWCQKISEIEKIF